MENIVIRFKGLAGLGTGNHGKEQVFTPEPMSRDSLKSLYKTLSLTPSPTLLNTLFILAAKYPIPNSDPRDAIVLTSEDDTCFLTSRTLLAAHSSVFAAASDVSTPLGANAAVESIPLSSTTTASLGLILAVLTILGTGPAFRRDVLSAEVKLYQPNFSAKDLITIGDAMDCAAAYEIISFGDHFVRPILNRLTDLDPVRGFALLGMTTRHPQAGQSTYAAKMVRKGITQLPSQTSQILAHFAPAHIGRYQHLCLAYAKSHAELRGGLRLGEPMTDRGKGARGGEDYAMQCKGWEKSRYDDAAKRLTYKHYRPACSAFLSKKRWSELRKRAADNVYAKVEKNGEGPSNYAAILPIVQRTVPCAKCAARLARTFEVAVRKFRSSAYKY